MLLPRYFPFVYVYSSLHAKEKPFIGCLSVRKGKEGQGGGPNVSKCCLYIVFVFQCVYHLHWSEDGEGGKT